jgi:3'(2'),5'-bisphosphate nucleotidase
MSISPGHAARTDAALAWRLGAIAVAAGAAIMRIYETGTVAEAKADGSPLTEADLAADAIIAQRLAAELPDIPIVSEENVPSAEAGSLPRFLLVDPLDGTKEFLARNGEFTVNIALVEAGQPTCGAVYAPVLGKLWVGAGA